MPRSGNFRWTHAAPSLVARGAPASHPAHAARAHDPGTARHAGHADIIRESIDGAAGLREGVSNMPAEACAAAWKQHYEKLDQIARSAR